VTRTGWFWALLALAVFLSPAAATGLRHRNELAAYNRVLHGQVLDFTKNHGADRALWSPALHQKRDLYVYLPPGFDPAQQYPVIIYMHGFMQDETSFLHYVVQDLDEAIASGRLPPVIAAAPDGSLSGASNIFSAGSFFVNSKAGRYEDYLIQDVWGFLVSHFPIRPEREAHVLAGASMGGFAAYNLAMKYPDMFKVVIGMFPPLNLRWVDCHGRYLADFDPCCWGWRTHIRSHEPVGRFYGGLVTVRMRSVVNPLYGRGQQSLADISRENPIEMMDRLDLQDGVLDMYVAYGGKDEFNLDAQVESFLYRAKERGLGITVAHDPNGRHDAATAKKFFPGMVEWLRPRLAPYSPPVGMARAIAPEIPGR
jgi:S-formylglutathione hydrolase FrmB